MDIYNIVKLFPNNYTYPKTRRVDDWNTTKVSKIIDLSNFAYLWFEKKYKEKTEDKISITIKKITKEQSGFYYINAYVETLEDLLHNNSRKDYKIIETMENMKWNSVVRSVNPENKWIYHFKEEDKLIDVEGNIIKV